MSKKPLINYDYESDLLRKCDLPRRAVNGTVGSTASVLYIVAKKAMEEEFIEIAPGINVELDDRGQVIGIEILNASKCLKPIAKPLYKNMQMA